MDYIDILAKFFASFPGYIGGVDTWEPNGKNSVIVTLHNRRRLVFTYHNDDEFELDSYAC